MSDTPRTDAHNWLDGDYDDPLDACYDFSCKLERELNAANDRIKRLEEENNELRAEEARLLNTNGELERRIKRLEEACGEMVSEEDTYIRLQTWRKAKEAKP